MAGRTVSPDSTDGKFTSKTLWVMMAKNASAAPANNPALILVKRAMFRKAEYFMMLMLVDFGRWMHSSAVYFLPEL